MFSSACTHILLAIFAATLDRADCRGPATVSRYDVAEFVVTVPDLAVKNPFTELTLAGEFTAPNQPAIQVAGFVDSADGRTLRLRFCPAQADATYAWRIALKAGEQSRAWRGELRCEPSPRPGPVIVDAKHPKHFKYAGSGKPFYHLGYTAYHLLDISNDDAQVQSLIDYCRTHGFNKIRFLLTGYPRDRDGVKDANYGAIRGQVNALPAWPGEPHHHDFTRFNVEFWRKADRAVVRMREAGIVATCIFTIEKQDLPKEYGALTDAEYRLYSYAIARLAAFDNVWWDLGNEHNEYRDRRWGRTMGRFVREQDPYDRLTSAHAYQDFWYPREPWADFITTQQYGDEKSVYDWAMKHLDIPKPYVNEEYGYEGNVEHNARGEASGSSRINTPDLVRRWHWSIAMAGGYATYGDKTDGVSYFYMGDPGTGVAATQLKHLRTFFEALPFVELKCDPKCVTNGFCLSRAPDLYVVYLPHGGEARVDVKAGEQSMRLRWFNPRTGAWSKPEATGGAAISLHAPDDGDWVALIGR